MHTTISTLGIKSQVTLPKLVRKTLHLKPGDPVGFLIDGSKITVCKAEIVPTHDPFTDKKWRKITAAFKSKKGKTYHSHEESMLHLRRLMAK